MIYPDIPHKALSIQQPWAWLIVNGYKDIENRDWRHSYRGPVAIHAGKTIDVDCEYALTAHDGPWHPVTGGNVDYDTGSRLIHENKTWETWSSPYWRSQTGGIVGVADIIDCVEQSESEWFVGRYGFVLANARPVPLIPVRGALGFFDWRNNLQGSL